MANFNKVLLIGNLTRDPELRFGSGGKEGSAVCRFGLAVNRRWRNQSGEQQEDTCFVDIVAFGRLAETCNEYLRKGRPVFVEGRLNYSTWEDRESGQKRSKLEVVGENVQFLGSRETGAPMPAGPRREELAGPGRDEVSAPAGTTPRTAAGEGIAYDDIPF
jgi:single-strand DNA-binding protein